MIQNAGTQVITADGVVSASSQAVRIFTMHVISTGGGAAQINLRTGNAVGGAIWVQETGTVSTGKTFNYGAQGVLFPSGCFCDVDANTTSVTLTFNNNS